jgi:hypothetical protein
MLATIALAEARGINSIVTSSAPMRRDACKISLSSLQCQLATRQTRDPVSVQHEKISRPGEAENSNSAAVRLIGDRPSIDMNQS